MWNLEPKIITSLKLVTAGKKKKFKITLKTFLYTYSFYTVEEKFSQL